jgi:hypothetical protein
MSRTQNDDKSPGDRDPNDDDRDEEKPPVVPPTEPATAPVEEPPNPDKPSGYTV